MGAQKNDGLRWVTKEVDYRKGNVNVVLGSVPKSKTVHVRGLDYGSGSDMDLGNYSDDDDDEEEEEAYGGIYAVESSPEDDIIRSAAGPNYSNAKLKQSYAGVNRACVNKPDIVRSVQCDAKSMLSSRGHLRSSVKSSGGAGEQISSDSNLPRFPCFHASALGPWSAMVAYDACVRLCLNSWAKGTKECSFFLDNDCAVLRNAFSLQHLLLQSEEELLSKKSSELIGGVAGPKPKRTIGKIKVQVRKVKMSLDPPSGCIFPRLSKLELEAVQYRLSNVKSRLSSGWGALQRVQVTRQIPKNGSISSKSLAYVHVGTRYMKEIGCALRTGLTSSKATSSSSYDAVQEIYYCLVRLKSSSDEDAVRMQPGSGESHIFFPDSPVDDLVLTVLDSKGTTYGRVVAQVASIMETANEKVRWWSIYNEPDNEPIGKLQLYVNCSMSQDDNSHLKCGIVAETVAYDMVLESAMKAKNFQQRNLLLHGHWKWLVTEFASFYGVSDAYTKLRYLSYVMDVATPTADCVCLIHELLSPVLMKGNALSHQEKRILGESLEKVEEIISLVFHNYKSLDETSLSGLDDVFNPATGVLAPAVAPTIKLYGLQHDMLSSETRLRLCKYFQVAAKKRSQRHLGETDEFVLSNDGTTVDSTSTIGYQKMKSLCLILKNEIYTDIEISNQDVLPSFLDLPNLSSAIYSVDLSNRLRTFLKACPPTGPIPHVTELVMTVADFERDLVHWNISFTKGGVNAKELFGFYISNWIKEKDLALLESCKAGMVKYSDFKAQQLTSPFLDEMYNQLRQTLNDYEIIVYRWPEYAIGLEKIMANVQNAMVEALDKHYSDVLAPLKDNLANLGLKYVQKFAKRTDCFYSVPAELGILLNSMRRMLDVLFPKVEVQLKSWSVCVNDIGNGVPGERLTEVTIMLRAKFRNYIQAVIEKLLENTKLQSSTRWKKIIQDFKETSAESDVQSRMQPLQDMVTKTIHHLHSIFETSVFVTVCRGFWDRMGQEVMNSLQNSKENRSWYKGVRIALRVLDETFTSEIEQLMGNSVQEKDLEPPRFILEAHSMLSKDSTSSKEGVYHY